MYGGVSMNSLMWAAERDKQRDKQRKRGERDTHRERERQKKTEREREGEKRHMEWVGNGKEKKQAHTNKTEKRKAGKCPTNKCVGHIYLSLSLSLSLHVSFDIPEMQSDRMWHRI